MNVEDDAEIIAWLEKQENKSEYIRSCILECKARASKNPAVKAKKISKKK